VPFLDPIVLKQFILEYEEIRKAKISTVVGFIGDKASSHLGGADSVQIEDTCRTLKDSFKTDRQPAQLIDLLLNLGRTGFKAQHLKLSKSASDLLKNLNAIRSYILLQIASKTPLENASEEQLRTATKTALENQLAALEKARKEQQDAWHKKVLNKDKDSAKNIKQAQDDYDAIVRDLAYLGNDLPLLTSGRIQEIFPGLAYPIETQELNAELNRKKIQKPNVNIPGIFQLAYAEIYVHEELQVSLGKNATILELERKAYKNRQNNNSSSSASAAAPAASASSSSSTQHQPDDEDEIVDTILPQKTPIVTAAVQLVHDNPSPSFIDPRVLKQFIVEYEAKRKTNLSTFSGYIGNLISNWMSNSNSLKVDETCTTFKNKFDALHTTKDHIDNLRTLGRTSWLAQELKLSIAKKIAENVPLIGPTLLKLWESTSEYCKALNAARNYALLQILSKNPLTNAEEANRTNVLAELNAQLATLEIARIQKQREWYEQIHARDSAANLERIQKEYDAILRDLAYLGNNVQLLTSGRAREIFPDLEYPQDTQTDAIDAELNRENQHKANPNIPSIFQLIYPEIYIRSELTEKLGATATLDDFINAACNNLDNNVALPTKTMDASSSSAPPPADNNPPKPDSSTIPQESKQQSPSSTSSSASSVQNGSSVAPLAPSATTIIPPPSASITSALHGNALSIDTTSSPLVTPLQHSPVIGHLEASDAEQHSLPPSVALTPHTTTPPLLALTPQSASATSPKPLLVINTHSNHPVAPTQHSPVVDYADDFDAEQGLSPTSPLSPHAAASESKQQSSPHHKGGSTASMLSGWRSTARPVRTPSPPIEDREHVETAAAASVKQANTFMGPRRSVPKYLRSQPLPYQPPRVRK